MQAKKEIDNKMKRQIDFTYRGQQCNTGEMGSTNTDWEYAAFAANGNAIINDTELADGTLMVFSNEGSSIVFENNTDTPIDILLFGGAPYTEPIDARGPFVMNSEAEITEAYRDYHLHKYGEVDHSKVQSIKEHSSSIKKHNNL